MRVHASLALPGVILAATAAASPQNYPSTPSFTYRAGGEPFGITFFGEEAAWRGWVAEDGGRIRYSDDGDEWIQAVVAGSVRGQLRGIQFIDDSVGFCVGDGGALLKTTNGGLNWTLLDTIFEPVAAETATLHQVYFHDEDDGWVMGDDLVLYHTTDGGDNWVEVTPQTPHNADFYDIAFPDPANRDLFVVASDYGFLYWTDDGGENWVETEFDVCDEVCPAPDPGLPEPCNFEIWSVDFYDEDNGIAVGGVNTNNGYILRTTDGGLTWTQENCMEFNCGESECAPVPTFYGVVATGVEDALAVGYASTVMRRTTDMENNGECSFCLWATGGYGWDETSQPGITNPPHNWIAVAEDDVAFATARHGRIRKITEGGTTLEDKGTEQSQRIEGGRFINATTGILVGQDRVILRRTSTAPNLELVDGPDAGTAYLNAVDISGSVVVAVGDGGKIRRSGSSGASGTWSDGSVQTSADFNNVRFTPNGNTVIAVGDGGLIAMSTDGGQNWTLPSALGADLHDIHCISDTTWVAVGASKYVAKTTDAGAHWSTVTVAGSSSPTLRAATGSGAHLWVVGDNGKVYRYNTVAEEFQLQSLGDDATTLQLTDAVRVPGTNDVLVTGDAGIVLYYDADKILQPGQGDEYKWSAPKSYMGAKLVSVDMFSATSGVITGFQTGVLEVSVVHDPF